MSRFDLLYEQQFTNTDTITVTHNLDRYIFSIRLIITGDPRLSKRELIKDIQLDVTTPLDKMIVLLTGTYTGTIQLIAEDTIQSPYYTVEEKLISQNQTPLAGTAPVKFEYGGNANAGRILTYVSFDDSLTAPYIVIADGKLRGIVIGATSSSIGDKDIGVYKKGSPDTLLYTATLPSGTTQSIDSGIDIDLLAGDELYVKILTTAISKPYVVIYTQTI